MKHYIGRRAFLKTVSIATAGATVGVGNASAGHSDEPSITFLDGTAQVLDNQGPMEAAVRTENVYMPAGGWVVISTHKQAKSSSIIGRSAQRLSTGH